MTFFFFVLLEGGGRIQTNTTIEMAFRWCADDGLTMNAGLVALWLFRGSGLVLIRTLYYCDFSGGVGPDPLSSPFLDPGMLSDYIKMFA